jgi:polar amino acid transport system permease protein
VAGLDFSWLSDPSYQRWLLQGLGNTILLAIVSSVLAVLIGMAGTFVLLLRHPVLDRALGAYIELFRNTPPLLQMLFFYFTLTSLGLTIHDAASNRDVPLLNAWSCAALSLSLFGGALCIEAFRSGFDAIPRATIEAARSLGYSRLALFRRVQVPIASRICLPALTNIITNLFKTTSQASVITVPELMYYAGQIYNENFRTLEVMMLVLVIYVVLVTFIALGLGRVEKMLAYPGYGR